MNLTPEVKAIELLNKSIKYVAQGRNYIDPLDLKLQAIDHAAQTALDIKRALYEVAEIDEYTPHASIDFYTHVIIKLNSLII